MRRTPLASIPLALFAWAASPVHDAGAQMRGSGGGMRNPPLEQGAQRPPPPGLPGLQYRRAPEPIPADPNQNLSPNAALFDAINRGDLPAAREAVGRGADVESRNVLGLTPVDAAVDQGRNEIMFFLLSVRAGSRVAPQPPEAAAAAAPPRSSGRRNTALPAAPVPAAESRMVAPTRQAPSPRLWVGDGGAANPSIGFLGFDAGRPAGAPEPEPRTAPVRATRTGRG